MFFPTLFLNFPWLCTNYIFLLCQLSKKYVLGCPTITKTIKVHGTVHQTHGTVNWKMIIIQEKTQLIHLRLY